MNDSMFLSAVYRYDNLEVELDPDAPNEVAVSIGGPYAFGLPLATAWKLHMALTEMVNSGDLKEA